MKHLSVQRSRRNHSALSLREMEYDTDADRKFSHEIIRLPKVTEFTFPEVMEFMLPKVTEFMLPKVMEFMLPKVVECKFYLKSHNSYVT